MPENLNSIHPSREQLLYWLHEAAEIEHNLMCTYLYAAYSLKSKDPTWTEKQTQLVTEWRRAIVSVALEEMSHLCLVGNMMSALGAHAHFNRPNFPIESGPYPAGFIIQLAPFCIDTLEHFMFLERPHKSALHDSSAFKHDKNYVRSVPLGRLSPGAKDYDTVGDLYEILKQSFINFCKDFDEKSLFIGKPELQVDESLAPLPGVCAVVDLKSALAAISTIVTQGEGAGSEQADSHFSKFTRIRDQLLEELNLNPNFSPAWPAATNPVMNQPLNSQNRVHINHPESSQILDLGNAIYTTSLRCLLQGFWSENRDAKSYWLESSYAMMRSLTPIASFLAESPASFSDNKNNAGITFTSLRTLSALSDSAATAFVINRISEIKNRSETFGKITESICKTLDSCQLKIGRISEATKSSSDTFQSLSPSLSIENFNTQNFQQNATVGIFFDSKKCIDSRNCALDLPEVFAHNPENEWFFLDNQFAEPAVAVVKSCPAGALKFKRLNTVVSESLPQINSLRVRENGPYAIHADHTVSDETRLRSALCRCGQSNNKPFCDGRHIQAGFSASGEAQLSEESGTMQTSGKVKIKAFENGPLSVVGNLRICTGTGQTIKQSTSANLCRCGNSKNKPFCDGSHVKAQFQALAVD